MTSIRPPDRACEIDDQPQLGLLHFDGDRIPGFHAGEAALRTYTEAGGIDEAAGVVNTAAQIVDILYRRGPCRDQAEDDGLGTRHEPQRREIAGAWAVVFEEEEADVEPVEQPFGDRIIAAFGMPAPAA